MDRLYDNPPPEKFSVIGAPDSVLPSGTLVTGLAICQIYFWNQ